MITTNVWDRRRANSTKLPPSNRFLIQRHLKSRRVCGDDGLGEVGKTKRQPDDDDGVTWRGDVRHHLRRQPAAASGVIRHRRTDPQSRYLSRGVPPAVNNRVLSRAPSAVKRRVTAPREGDPATLGVGKLRHTYTRPGAVRARCLPACLLGQRSYKPGPRSTVTTTAHPSKN